MMKCLVSTMLAALLAGATTAAAEDTPSPAPAEFAAMPACQALQTKYPGLKGKELVVGLGGYNKGFQSPKAGNPDQLEGLDPDMFDRLGACLGFTYKFQLGAFNVLITSLTSGVSISGRLSMSRRPASNR